MSVVEMAMALESNLVYARIPQQAPECRSTANWGLESGWEDPAQRSEWASVSSTSISVASTLVKDEPDENGRAAAGGLSDGSSSVMTLKLGRRTYFEDPTAKPPGKKPRHPSPPSAAQIPRCQVEGCKADLSGCKDYYKRHKVCEMHSKAPRAVAGGIEQRFCQQCSRFHVLQEFDEGKRSCRRRLAGHNERRRKPHPETHSLFGLGNSFLHTNFSTPSLYFSEDSKPLNLLNPQSSSSLDYRLNGYGSSPWSVKGRNDNIPTFQLENLEAPSTPSKPSSLSSLHLGGRHFVEGPLGPLGQGLSLGNLEQSSSCSQDLMMNSGRALSLLSSQSSWASRPYLGASSTPVYSTLEQLVASSCISDSSSRESRFAHHLRFPAQQESFSLQSGARQLDSVTTHQHQSCSNVGNMLGAWYQEWNPMSLEAASYEADRPTVDLMQQHSVGAPHSSFQTLAVSGGQYSGFSSLRQSLESSVFTSQQFL